jgi:predicted transcriptional regulator of viral defense system
MVRNRIQREEFDHQTLLDALRTYARPRDKISDLMRKGIIVRVKKGLYIFGKDHRREYYSRELLANLIYGPSYLSFEYALQYYGMIPERVEAVTSVTIGRSKRFNTPIGLFTYRKIPVPAFRIGMTRVARDHKTAFLIATPEKALADKVRDDRGGSIQSLSQMITYLSDNLRVDDSALRELDSDLLLEIGRRYHSRKIRILADVVRQRKGSFYHE